MTVIHSLSGRDTHVWGGGAAKFMWDIFVILPEGLLSILLDANIFIMAGMTKFYVGSGHWMLLESNGMEFCDQNIVWKIKSSADVYLFTDIL